MTLKKNVWVLKVHQNLEFNLITLLLWPKKWRFGKPLKRCLLSYIFTFWQKNGKKSCSSPWFLHIYKNHTHIGTWIFFSKSPNFFSPWLFFWSREASYWFSSKLEHYFNISSLFLFFSNSTPWNSSKLKMTISQLFMFQMDWNFAWLPTLVNCFIASKKFENQKFSLPVFVRITVSSSLKAFHTFKIRYFVLFIPYGPPIWVRIWGYLGSKLYPNRWTIGYKVDVHTFSISSEIWNELLFITFQSFQIY